MKTVKVNLSLFVPVDFAIESEEDVEAAIAFANQVLAFYLKQAVIKYEHIDNDEEDNEDLIIDVD